MEGSTLLRTKMSAQGQTEPSWGLGPIAQLLEQLTAFLWRQYRVFAAAVACALALGGVYLIATPAYFTAKTMVVIDGNQARSVWTQRQQTNETVVDAGRLDTQVELLKSEKIALAVIRELRLLDGPEFAEPTGALRMLANLVAWKDRSEDANLQNALSSFLRRRAVNRVGRSYLLEISYSSTSPDRAAAIANALAEAYIVDQLETKYQATRRASSWLQNRINELRAQSLAAERAVVDFKEKNNIVDVGPAGSNRLIAEQQLAELNSQLINARVATNEANARLDRIVSLMNKNIREATVPDSLKNEVINRLRNQYLDLAARESNWSQRYGEDHLAVTNIRHQMEDLRTSIADELKRLAASYASEYEIAKARERSLEKSLNSLISEGQVTKRDQVGLNELESGAKAYRTIYDSFLQHYTEVIQQQSFPIAEARVVGEATPPQRKSGPLTVPVLAFSGVLGLMLGAGFAALREILNHSFRTARQVEEALHAPCLSILPKLAPATSADRLRRRIPGASDAAQRPPVLDAGTGPDKVAAGAPRASRTDAMLRHVVDDPFSPFTEGVRAIKIAAELQAAIKANKVIGVTSTLATEGKSTVACNLAQLMAHARKRVVLVDADLRKPSLGSSIDPPPSLGLRDVLSGKAALSDALRIDAASGLSILPSLAEEGLVHTDAIVSSNEFRALIDRLREDFDFVILDLPPLGPVVDVRAAAQAIDSIVFVIEWGRTRISVVARHLEAAPEVYDRIAGFVLNKAEGKLSLGDHRYYGGYGAAYLRPAPHGPA